MSDSTRGVLYIIWGDKVESHVQRSIESLRMHHPDLPVHIERVTPRDSSRGLREKSRIGAITPFKTTLYLDADTTVMGNLDHAFEQAERFGLACVMCESPWLRRYAKENQDRLEYNTGVLFFTQTARDVFDTWDRLADTTPAASRWSRIDGVVRGMPYEDQASFGAALDQCNHHPFVLPLNYNFRPAWHSSVFLPLKIWHDYIPPPEGLCKLSLACERGEKPVTHITFKSLNVPTPPPHQQD